MNSTLSDRRCSGLRSPAARQRLSAGVHAEQVLLRQSPPPPAHLPERHSDQCDCDLRPENSGEPQLLHYNISEASLQGCHFAINSTSGQITTATDQFEAAICTFEVTAFDGKHTFTAKVFVHAKPLPRSSLRFRRDRYYGTITENSSLIKTVVVPGIEGNKLHEHLLFCIMNPTEHFRIARTSGAMSPSVRPMPPWCPLSPSRRRVPVGGRCSTTLNKGTRMRSLRWISVRVNDSKKRFQFNWFF